MCKSYSSLIPSYCEPLMTWLVLVMTHDFIRAKTGVGKLIVYLHFKPYSVHCREEGLLRKKS